jgi:uncharacterized repeat protein (TIGR03803 family)
MPCPVGLAEFARSASRAQLRYIEAGGMGGVALGDAGRAECDMGAENGKLGCSLLLEAADGGYPAGGLIEGNDGNLYGTTQYGGLHGQGTVFSLATNGMLNMEASFDGTNGAQPGAALVQGGDGNFYGTTEGGGTYQNGTIFRITPGGKLTPLVSFGGDNGAEPAGALMEGADGNFYGTTQEGGTNGYGTIFRMAGDGSTLTTMATFNLANGASPQGKLVQAGDGSLYGVTEEGGTNGYGTVFCLATNGTLTTLAFFSNGDGAYPQGGSCAGSRWEFLRNNNRRRGLQRGNGI